MVLVTLSPNGVALSSHCECALSQVGTRPDVTLDVARTNHPVLSHRHTGLTMHLQSGHLFAHTSSVAIPAVLLLKIPAGGGQTAF